MQVEHWESWGNSRIWDQLRWVVFLSLTFQECNRKGTFEFSSWKINNGLFVSGTTKLSDHAIGLAIDINPKQNPWVHPSALNKFPYILGEKGTIEKGDDVVSIFEKYGWSWGGNWRNPDYQHFFKGGDVNKRVKNKLYDDLDIEDFKNDPYSGVEERIEEHKIFVAEHYIKNRSKYIEKSVKWQKENPKKCKEKSAKYYADNIANIGVYDSKISIEKFKK